MQNNYFYKWIDSNKDDEINSFKVCIDSYIYFKKDAFYKTNKLIKKKPEFNAPKLLKIVLLLFSRDVQKISLARETLQSISKKYLSIKSIKKHLIKNKNVCSNEIHPQGSEISIIH